MHVHVHVYYMHVYCLYKHQRDTINVNMLKFQDGLTKTQEGSTPSITSNIILTYQLLGFLKHMHTVLFLM